MAYLEHDRFRCSEDLGEGSFFMKVQHWVERRDGRGECKFASTAERLNAGA